MSYSRKKKLQFLADLDDNGGNISNTCKLHNICRQTFYNWYKAKWFQRAVDEITEKCLDMVESALYRNALEGNVTAQIYYLKCKGKKRGWIEKTELQLDADKITIHFGNVLEGYPEQ